MHRPLVWQRELTVYTAVRPSVMNPLDPDCHARGTRSGVLLRRQMHNWRRCATDVPCNFTIKSLALLAVVYLHLMSLASGIAVPGGLFMPSIMVRPALVSLCADSRRQCINYPPCTCGTGVKCVRGWCKICGVLFCHACKHLGRVVRVRGRCLAVLCVMKLRAVRMNVLCSQRLARRCRRWEGRSGPQRVWC